MGGEKELTYRDLRRLHQPRISSDRDRRVADFAENLETAAAHEDHRVLFNVYGQGGTGKTWLLTEFAARAEESGAQTGWSDESESSVVEAMRRMASSFPRGLMREYLERDSAYLRFLSDVIADQQAPPALAATLGRAGGRLGLAIGRQVPGVSVVLEFVDEEAVATQGAEFAAYLATKFKRQDDLSLLVDPISSLTPAFVAGLRAAAAGGQPVAIFLDTYEVTSEFLEEWLVDLFNDSYGDLPASLVWAIAGQSELDRKRWSAHEPWIARVPLDVFTDDEATTYLHQRHVTDERVVAEIVRLSGRLPVLLATLAAQSPKTLEDLGDPSGTAIDVFLKWMTDDERQVALSAAAPRVLNEEILTLVLASEARSDAHERFEWLRARPFVQERAEGWVYHSEVRKQLFRHQSKTSPREWAKLHAGLASHYDRVKAPLERQPPGSPIDAEAWAKAEAEAVYHSLVADRTRLPEILTRFARARVDVASAARRIALAIRDAGQDADQTVVGRWGETCVQSVSSADVDERLEAYTSLIESGQLTDEKLGARLLFLRGITSGNADRHSEALDDFLAAIEVLPDAPDIHGNAAVAYERLGRKAEALTSASTAIDRASGNVAAQANWLRLRAELHLADGDLQAASTDADAALKIRARAATFMTRGRVRAAQERYLDAVEDFKRALAMDERFRHVAMHHVGAALRRAGREDEAEEALLESLRASRNCSKCWAELVPLLVRHKETVASRIATIEEELPLSARGHRVRAHALSDAGCHELAVADMRRALDGEPDSAGLNNLGLWLTYLGDFAEAISAYEAALKLEPREPIVLYNLAVARARLEGSDAAASDIDRARAHLTKEIQGSTPVIGHYGLAGLEAVQGHAEAALARLEIAGLVGLPQVKHWAMRDVAWADLRNEAAFAEALRDPR